jgi:hypothetical protein
MANIHSTMDFETTLITFTQTCDKPYDRHKYKVHLPNKVITCDYYEDARAVWFQNPFAQYIEVVDRKKKR